MISSSCLFSILECPPQRAASKQVTEAIPLPVRLILKKLPNVDLRDLAFFLISSSIDNGQIDPQCDDEKGGKREAYERRLDARLESC